MARKIPNRKKKNKAYRQHKDVSLTLKQPLYQGRSLKMPRKSPLAKTSLFRYTFIVILECIAMGLPGHRRTSSHKRRRASHFALRPAVLTTDKKTGAVHLPHKAAPGAKEYRGIPIHIKGRDRKLQKALDKKKPKTPSSVT